MSNWKIKHLHELKRDPFAGTAMIPCLAAGEMRGVEADYVVVRPEAPIEPHRHRRASCFTFVVEGPVEAVLDGKPHRLIMNDFLIVPPGVVHGYRALESTATLFVIHAPPIRNGDRCRT